MKIAVASDRKTVAEHFGYCEAFILFETEKNQIISEKLIPNPGHKPGFLPVFLYERGVNVIISGGMGAGAIDIFNEKGIEVIIGASGESKNAAEKYIKGELKTTGSVCHEHNHDNQ